MFISVIVPVRNEEKHIGEVLDALTSQKITGAFEVLVIDGQSTDRTVQIVQEYCGKYPNVRLFDNPKRLSSVARNIGVKNAKGDAVLIVDGHCIISDDNMLANVVKAFEESGADCLARPQPLEMQNATVIQWAIASARRSPLGHNPNSFIYSDKAQFSPASSAAIAYRKSVFEKVGYFDETFDACEDVEFNTRCDKAGLKCWFDPAIAVRYVPRNSIKGLAYQLYRYGRGRMRLFRKHPETFSWSMFGLGAFVAYVIFIFCLLFSFVSASIICGYADEHTVFPVFFVMTYGVLAVYIFA
ncbi:MAG: glycosyltransferase family 2 protein, partial [Planctomycetaceae bacterium]|nr:glycosyltransferase family 2 protein [Planctomycetaceae bacterium]